KCAGLEARQKFAQCRHVWELIRARVSPDREGAQLARPNMLNGCRQVVERRLHLAAQQIGHQRRRAAVRHVLHADTGGKFKSLARHVRGRAGAERCERDLARIGLGERDQLRHDLAATDGCTSSTSGERTTPETIAMSRTMLKLSLSKNVALTV